MSIPSPKNYLRHLEVEKTLATDAGNAFEYLDDHERLAAHMTSTSTMMAGGHMSFEFDEGGGRAIGSLIRMTGSFLGIALTVEERVTERKPPLRKVWETCGSPRLLMIGHYRMGFELTAEGGDCLLRVFIDYDLPTGFGRVLGLLAGAAYARWCVHAMAADAARHFAPIPLRPRQL